LSISFVENITQPSMATPHARLIDFLLSNVNIYVSGGSGPKREGPIECFRPVHQSYHHPHQPNQPPIAFSITSAFPGGAMRSIESTASPTGSAIVFDRDLITTWRLPNAMAAYEIFF